MQAPPKGLVLKSRLHCTCKMAAELATAAPEPENDINEETEVELSEHENHVVVMFSFDAFAHALSGATVSSYN